MTEFADDIIFDFIASVDQVGFEFGFARIGLPAGC